MSGVLWLMLVQGLLGAFDTAYFHEYRARLPAGGARTRVELWLHAVRDFVYGSMFLTLPFRAWGGALAWLLAGLIALEILLTMADFVVEVRAREPEGVHAYERVTHGLMAIVYGAMLARFLPELFTHWTALPYGFSSQHYDVPAQLPGMLALLGVGVVLSGVRDAYAALGLPGGAFPWRAA
jgi:hypothetical protein